MPITAGVPKYANQAIYNAAHSGVDPAAMSIGQFITPSQRRASGVQRVQLIADAKGGVKQVDWLVEDTLHTGDTGQIYSDTDVNGNARTYPCWGIDVDCATAFAAHPTGAVRVYAKIVPNDVTITPRIIGPITIYPRAAQYDWDVTVNPSGGNTGSSLVSGGNYQTLAAAMQGMKDALKLHGFECGRVTITQSGTYDWGHPDAFGFPWSKGYSCVTHAPGVTATIARFNNSGVNAWDPTQGGVANGSISDPWAMFSYVQNIEFRGSGVIIDRRNISQMLCDTGTNGAENLHHISGLQLTTGGFYFNGCKQTNSAGAHPRNNWNETPGPALAITEPNNTNYVPVHSEANIVEYDIQGGISHSRSTSFGMKILNGAFGAHQGASLILQEVCDGVKLGYENYYNGWLAGSPATEGNHLNATISYSGAGTTADIRWLGGNWLTLNVNGSEVASFQVMDPSSPRANGTTQFSTWTQIKAYIDANLPDWSITLPGNQLAPWYLRAAVQTSFPADAKAGPVQIKCAGSSHAEWMMCYGLGADGINNGFENAIVWMNKIIRSGWSTGFLQNQSSVGYMRDWSQKYNVYDPLSYLPNDADPTQDVVRNTATWDHHGRHVMYDRNTTFSGISFNFSASDAYSSLDANICNYMSDSGNVSSNRPTNSIHGGSIEAGSSNVYLVTDDATVGNAGSGSVEYYTDWLPLFRDAPNQDWTPYPGSRAAMKVVASDGVFDLLGRARASTDAIGAVRLDATKPGAGKGPGALFIAQSAGHVAYGTANGGGYDVPLWGAIGSNALNGRSLTIDTPQAGDIAIVWTDNTASQANPFSSPGNSAAAYTPLDNRQAATSGFWGQIGYRVLNAADISNGKVTITGGGVTYGIIVLRGATSVAMKAHAEAATGTTLNIAGFAATAGNKGVVVAALENRPSGTITTPVLNLSSTSGHWANAINQQPWSAIEYGAVNLSGEVANENVAITNFYDAAQPKIGWALEAL